MKRLCERPGCSEIAAVAYGMRAEELVFWIDAIGGGPGPDRGVLCQRHGDTMVVPRGWTLDDQRDPDLHLFRPPPRNGAKRPRRTPVDRANPTEQLELDGVVPEPVEQPVESPVQQIESPAEQPTDEAAASWTPAFDAADDLDGLLKAKSPLLSRAFRVDDR